MAAASSQTIRVDVGFLCLVKDITEFAVHLRQGLSKEILMEFIEYFTCLNMGKPFWIGFLSNPETCQDRQGGGEIPWGKI
jgi:hypothetical protein